MQRDARFTTLVCPGIDESRGCLARPRGRLNRLSKPSRSVSQRRMASRPSSLSMLTLDRSFPLTAAHVASKARSKISRSRGSNSCRSDLNKINSSRHVKTRGHACPARTSSQALIALSLAVSSKCTRLADSRLIMPMSLCWQSAAKRSPFAAN